MESRPFWLLFALALAAGAAIMWIGTLPSWEGTGVICVLIVIVTTVLGFLRPQNAFAFALAVSAWIAALGLLRGNPPALFAFVVGIGGAFIGATTRRLLASISP